MFGTSVELNAALHHFREHQSRIEFSALYVQPWRVHRLSTHATEKVLCLFYHLHQQARSRVRTSGHVHVRHYRSLPSNTHKYLYCRTLDVEGGRCRGKGDEEEEGERGKLIIRIQEQPWFTHLSHIGMSKRNRHQRQTRPYFCIQDILIG